MKNTGLAAINGILMYFRNLYDFFFFEISIQIIFITGGLFSELQEFSFQFQ